MTSEPRTDWTKAEIESLFELPFNDLLYSAQWVHRQNFDPNAVQVSTLLSIKTGACPEDCAYCPQSIRFETAIDRHDLMPLDEVRAAARRARDAGATRFCMGASYRGPKDSQLEPILAMIKEVKAMGLETCATLGLLRPGQAERLAEAGLDYYNHNLDSSPEFYEKIISTRTYGDRLETLERVRAAGVKVCCGGIVGMGETRADRIGLLHTLATLAAAARKRADQRARADSGHAARGGRRRSIRSNSSAASPLRGSSCRARTCGCRRAAAISATSCRRCASSRAPTRSSTARSC